MRRVLFRLLSWLRPREAQRPPSTAESDIETVVRRNSVAYEELHTALEALLAARNQSDAQIGTNLRLVYDRIEPEPPARFQRLLDCLREQDRGE